MQKGTRIFRMGSKKGKVQFCLAESDVAMELVSDEKDVKPGLTYYIRPNTAPFFYETTFSSLQHWEQINELLTQGKIWQTQERKVTD